MTKRVYKNADGVRVPSVTTVLSVINKPALQIWANNIGLEGIKMYEYVDDKADIGTLAHSICEFYLTKKLLNGGNIQKLKYYKLAYVPKNLWNG